MCIFACVQNIALAPSWWRASLRIIYSHKLSFLCVCVCDTLELINTVNINTAAPMSDQHDADSGSLMTLSVQYGGTDLAAPDLYHYMI